MKRKLSIRKDTIRLLSDSQLASPRGGDLPTSARASCNSYLDLCYTHHYPLTCNITTGDGYTVTCGTRG